MESVLTYSTEINNASIDNEQLTKIVNIIMLLVVSCILQILPHEMYQYSSKH